MVIVIGAGLLVKSLYLLQRVDTGVRTANIIDVDLCPLPRGRSETPASATGTISDSHYPAMLERIAALPACNPSACRKHFRDRRPPATPVSFVGEPESTSYR